MLTYKKTHNIYSIKEEWLALEQQGCCTSPFLSFEYMKRAWLLFYPYYITRKYLPVFYSFYDNGKCVTIIPLVRWIKGNHVELFGAENGFNYTDIIACDSKYIKEALSLLKGKYDKIACNKVLESSFLWESVADICEVRKTTNNVCIHFGDDYDLFNKSLSKSTRQNLRTSYNRLVTDGKCLSVRQLIGGGVQHCEYQCFIDLYTARHKERYGVETSKLKKWLLLHQSFATDNYLKNPEAITFGVYIDGELAAFMSGVKGCRNEYVVPRLSINDDFKFYSPGMILLNEAIKFFIEKTNIRHLDLSQGEEQYKYKMGGETHCTHDFVIDLTKL